MRKPLSFLSLVLTVCAIGCSSGGGGTIPQPSPAASGNPGASAGSSNEHASDPTSGSGDRPATTPTATGTSDPATPPASSSCPDVTALMCHLAAQCAGDGRAILAYLGQGHVVATEEHNNESECKTFYAAMGCQSMKADFPACSSALQSFALTDCHSTNKGNALPVPASCNTK